MLVLTLASLGTLILCLVIAGVMVVRTWRRRETFRWWLVALRMVGSVVVMFSIGVVVIGFYPLWELKPIPIELHYMSNNLIDARQLWDAHDIQNYDVDIQFGSGAHLCILGDRNFRLHVRNNLPVMVSGGANDCLPDDITPEAMFERINEHIENPDTLVDRRYEFNYDETYGFVSSYRISCFWSAHCSLSFEYSNFTPVEPGAPIEPLD